MNQRAFGKEREGFVTSNRMQKTVVVSMERIVLHSKYKKYLKRRTKVKVHDKKDECRIGDRVLIVECRPMSREIRWRVKEVLERGVGAEGLNPESSTAS